MTMEALTHRGSLTRGITAINGNFSALLSAVEALEGRVTAVVGSYTGTRDSSNYIELPFQPKLVYVSGKGNAYYPYWGFALEGIDNGLCELTENGFHPTGMLNLDTQSAGGIDGTHLNPYRYIALTWTNDNEQL